MTSYLTGALIELINPVVHAWSNVLDGYFSNKIFQKLSSLIFFGSFVNILFLPLVLFIGMPSKISIGLVLILIPIALIEVCFQYPYYWSLRSTDPSIVSSLFSLGKVFVPILAFFIVGERLSIFQYVGFGIIVVSSVFLTFNPKKFRLNKAFYLMLFVSFILCLQGVLYKYAFNAGMTWPTAIFWGTGFEFIIAGAFTFLIRSNRADFGSSIKKVHEAGSLIVFNQFLSWIGNVADPLAISLIPVSVSKSITSLQPLFVILYTTLFKKRKPHLFKDYPDDAGTTKKIALFLLVIVGTVLVVV